VNSGGIPHLPKPGRYGAPGFRYGLRSRGVCEKLRLVARRLGISANELAAFAEDCLIVEAAAIFGGLGDEPR